MQANAVSSFTHQWLSVRFDMDATVSEKSDTLCTRKYLLFIINYHLRIQKITTRRPSLTMISQPCCQTLHHRLHRRNSGILYCAPPQHAATAKSCASIRGLTWRFRWWRRKMSSKWWTSGVDWRASWAVNSVGCRSSRTAGRWWDAPTHILIAKFGRVISCQMKPPSKIVLRENSIE